MSGDNLHGKQPIKFYSEEVTLSKLIITNKDSRETMKSFHIYLDILYTWCLYVAHLILVSYISHLDAIW